MAATTRKPSIPGKVLLEKFVQPHALTQDDLANHIHVARRRINEIINGKRAITSDTALRLARLFNTTPEYWLDMQMKYDLWEKMNNKKILQGLKKIRPLPKKSKR